MLGDNQVGRAQVRRTTIAAKRSLLRVLDRELDALTGRFLSEEEQLRVLSINDEQERLEGELLAMGVTEF